MKMRLWAVLLLCLGLAARADDLDTILQKQEVVIGVKDASPPFGVYDKAKGTVSGYDIDFALGIAKRLGVKPVFRTVNPDDRIPFLQERKVDLVIATFTKSPERERLLEFSLGYFVTGQKFLVPAGKYQRVEELNRARIGVVNASTSEKTLRKQMPEAQVMPNEDYPEMVRMLQAGQLDAISTDEPILAGLLGKMSNRSKFEIMSTAITFESYGVGMRKGEKKLLKAVNDALLDMENTGEAKRIFDRWFGPNSSMPMMRFFTIRN